MTDAKIDGRIHPKWYLATMHGNPCLVNYQLGPRGPVYVFEPFLGHLCLDATAVQDLNIVVGDEVEDQEDVIGKVYRWLTKEEMPPTSWFQ